LDSYERLLLNLKNKFQKNKTSFKQLFKDVDQDGSGLVSREEFRKFLLK